METYFHGLSKEEIVELLPDTIYLPKKEIVERLPWIAEPYKDDPNWDECYIRKDALLEWAKANLQDRDNWNEKSAADAFDELIDKLNEM